MRELFPNLTESNHRITSRQTGLYNCIAWSIGNDLFWLWPDEDDQYYWPENVLREVSVDAFVAFYQHMGYERCPSAVLEADFEKIALYLVDGVPEHAARQLESGKWTSKLGELVDIEHSSLLDVSGSINGVATIYFKRQRSLPRPQLPPLRPKPKLVLPGGNNMQDQKIIL